jgi:hypothetical protein
VAAFDAGRITHDRLDAAVAHVLTLRRTIAVGP